MYEARRESDSVRVALKMANADDPFAIRRLWYEALAMRAVAPPEVPELYDDGTAAGGEIAYIAMEWVTSPTLGNRMDELLGPMSIEEFGHIVPAVLRAVQALHSRGFVHRDLKPEHVVLCGTGDDLSVRLLDLGLVKPIRVREPLEVRPRGLAVGTSRYMPPEQVSDGPVDIRADIYALGVIMFELLSGVVVFDGTSSQMRDAHLSHVPPDLGTLSEIPPPIARVVMRCLRKRRVQRYQSVQSLRGALTRALRRARAAEDAQDAQDAEDAQSPRRADGTHGHRR